MSENPKQPKLRLQDRRRRLMWIKVAAGTAVVAICLVLMFYVSHLPQTTITEVNVTGTDLVNPTDVKTLVVNYLKGSYAYLLPHANTFLIPVSSISSTIVNTFPPVEKVSLLRTSLTSLNVQITERAPVALWCAGTPAAINASSSPKRSANTCYLLDKGGFIFAKAMPEDSYLRYYAGLSANPVGSTYLSGDFLLLNKTVQEIGDSVNRIPENVTVDQNSRDVSVAFSGGGILRFVRAINYDSTLQNIASVFGSESFKSNKNFEYVDFRFGDKVYVKFK